MDAKQRGFTLIEILVVVTIIGVLAGLVVVLIPKSQAEAAKLDCMNNIRQMVGLIEANSATKYPNFGDLVDGELLLVHGGEDPEPRGLGQETQNLPHETKNIIVS